MELMPRTDDDPVLDTTIEQESLPFLDVLLSHLTVGALPPPLAPLVLTVVLPVACNFVFELARSVGLSLGRSTGRFRPGSAAHSHCGEPRPARVGQGKGGALGAGTVLLPPWVELGRCASGGAGRGWGGGPGWRERA